jgi:hypothetical protein
MGHFTTDRVEDNEVRVQSEKAAETAAEAGTGHWQGHRFAALLVRALVFLGPVGGAAIVGLLVSRSLSGSGVGALVVRVLITATVSVAAFVLVERLARRFLPLAALLRLNLVFPDRAPSRFSVALRSTSVRKLQQWVRDARESENVAVLAEKVVTLASALNTHDRRTRGHCERTRALADLIVEELHLSPAQANEVRWGAFLHDIGKLVVPPEILNKPGKPTTREWEVLRSHPEAGARLVEPLRTFLGSGVDAVGSHHENYDGSGYPAGLAGEQLPLAARIVSVADAFEVMTAVRAYKRPMTLQAAREELALRSGSQFDPQVVRAFLNVSLGRVHWTLGVAAWIAELPFLSVLPRAVAQVGAPAGITGAVSPIALPGIAAASLGAMAMVGHVHAPPSAAPRATAHRTPTVSAPKATNDEASVAVVPAASAAPTASSAVTAPVATTLDPVVAATSAAAAALHLTTIGGDVDATVQSLEPSATLPAAVQATGQGVDGTVDAVGHAVVGPVAAVGEAIDSAVDALGAVSDGSGVPSLTDVTG